MVLIARKRYHIWLLKAYFKKLKKTILTSLILGVFAFFAGYLLLQFYLSPLLERKVEKIGYAGVYDLKNLPEEKVYDLSEGLTKIDQTGEIKPSLAYKWEIKDQGKKYIFYLKKNINFHNGKEFTAETLNLNFKDVQKKVLDKYKVEYDLKNPYSPFLSQVSKPIFIDNLSGVGAYKLNKIDFNAGFVKSLTIQNTKDKSSKKIINFYSTQESLKLAFLLGEVDKITGVKNLSIKDKSFKEWKNVKIEKYINYNQLITIFYNNNDQHLQDKKLRQALNYALPEEFNQGERAYSPIPPNSIYYSQTPNYQISDISIAKTLLENNEVDKELELTTTEEYKDVAKIIQQRWKSLGVKTKIKVVNEIPSSFQILLYSFKVRKDPDQYTIWHSNQVNNITHYRNLRIDKLLEDGRSISDINKRVDIYADFQKYLIDDVPASFLYFPYEYNIYKK
ncbi:ABC transporter substrate-binding protein [Candidatus Parcubacteria bacterium]|nr:MAG: ABC transporter substrate-binding protein [Candidatus Parcubacteria bacterium]